LDLRWLRELIRPQVGQIMTEHPNEILYDYYREGRKSVFQEWETACHQHGLGEHGAPTFDQALTRLARLASEKEARR
jgi:hypothetical protein